MVKLFQYLEMITTHIESGYAFEHFCLNANEFDKYVFINHTLEDDVYSGSNTIGMVYRWNENLNDIAGKSKFETVTAQISREEAIYKALQGKSKITKALYYFLFEPKMFWKKVKAKLKKKK